MPKIEYINKRFGAASLGVIRRANEICQEYAAQGFDLTLRQLYYQFVARGYIPNRQSEYKRLGDIINDARLAGLLDWNYIVDRTRNLRTHPSWSSPESIVRSAAASYRIDKWASQPVRIEVWIEKDALTGVIAPVCNRNQIPYFACRGYVSQSEMWAAGERYIHYRDQVRGQETIVLHLGDHDPSGIDMTKDIRDRTTMFLGGIGPTVRRIALNMDQIQQYNPPPNPAKMTDSRFASYLLEYGSESWELDALEPTVIDSLIEQEILRERDNDAWDRAVEREEKARRELERISERYGNIVEYLEAS